MRLVIQRSKNSSVKVNDKIVGKISSGLVILVGFTESDTDKDIDYAINKIINMRIFSAKPEESILDIKGEILAISQFTLYADVKNGRRPSYVEALSYNEANQLYEKFINKLKQTGLKVETGVFGADMEVSIINDGPFTIIFDTKDR